MDYSGKTVSSLHDCSDPEVPNGYETAVGIFGRTLLKRDNNGKAELLAFGCSRTRSTAVINMGIYAAEARKEEGVHPENLCWCMREMGTEQGAVYSVGPVIINFTSKKSLALFSRLMLPRGRASPPPDPLPGALRAN